MTPNMTTTQSPLQSLTELTKRLFPMPVVTASMDPRHHRRHGTLLPEEHAVVAHAHPKRIREYTAGRLCARRALHQLGLEPSHIGPLLQDKHRLPTWPQGVVGSISHTDTACIVAVMVANVGADVDVGIGVDIEAATPLNPALFAKVCTASELTWLHTQPSDQRAQRAKLIFSIKEAAYKCQYPLTHTYLGFQSMSLRLDLHSNTFEAQLQQKAGAFNAGDLIQGRFATTATHIVSAAFIKE